MNDLAGMLAWEIIVLHVFDKRSVRACCKNQEYKLVLMRVALSICLIWADNYFIDYSRKRPPPVSDHFSAHQGWSLTRKLTVWTFPTPVGRSLIPDVSLISKKSPRASHSCPVARAFALVNRKKMWSTWGEGWVDVYSKYYSPSGPTKF